jgi:tetratricopeptide (TPR) repeat protein
VQVPRELEIICLKCLEKNPLRRYASAHELAADLRRYLEGEPIQARPVSAWVRLGKRIRRRPATAALVGITCLAMLALGAVMWRNDAHVRNQENLIHDREVAKVAESRRLIQAFSEAQDDALFYGFRGIQLQSGDWPANSEATREAIAKALGVVGLSVERSGEPVFHPYWSLREKAEITAGCYQLLLLAAEASSQRMPEEPAPDYRSRVVGALAILDRAAKLVPATKAYHLRRARYLTLLGDEPGAQQERKRGDALRPTSALDHFLVGYERCQEHQVAAAIRSFEHAADLQPDDFWPHFFLALCYLDQGAYLDADACLSDCIRLRPTFAWNYLVKSLVEEKRNHRQQAESNLDRARQLIPDSDPRYYFFYVDRGSTRAERGQVEEAVADLQKAIAAQPHLSHAYLSLAQVYQGQGKLEAAHEVLDRVLQLGLPAAAIADCRAEQSRTFFRQGNYEWAVQSARAGLAVSPRHTRCRFRLIQALLELERGGEALEALDRYVADKGSMDANFCRLRGRARFQQGNYPGAVDDYTRALAQDAAAVQAEDYRYRGWAYYFAEAYKPALRDFEEAIRLSGDPGEAYIGRGLARVQLGQYREGVADADEALRRKPIAAAMLHNIACIFALAVPRVQGDAQEPRSSLLAERYRDSAVQVLKQSVAAVAPRGREAFWRNRIMPDHALDAVRDTPAFRALGKELGTPVGKP